MRASDVGPDEVCDPAPRPRIMLVTARMGAGHNGVAEEFERRLSAEGAEIVIVDFLDALPAGLGAVMQRIYRAQLRYAPWTYDLLYRLRFRFSGAWSGINAFYTRITRRRILDWIDTSRADVVLSLYPLAGTVLAELRRRGDVAVPVATFVTDFGVHPLWVHHGADEHVCVHEQAAEEAARRTGGTTRAPGPVVPPMARPTPEARRARRVVLGVGPDNRMVVVSGGSWVSASIMRTVDTLVGSGRYVPVVLCGHDETLRARVRSAGAIGVGWIDDVPLLIGAADALVDNGGGLTCMEAFAVGTPVVTYRPIAGHGRHNAAEMQRAGVSRYPRSPQGLIEVLDALCDSPERAHALTGAAALMFAGDASKDVLALARSTLIPAPQ